MTVKRLIKQVVYKKIYPLARLYWFLVRPKTRGVKCLVKYKDKFLLVKLNYAHRRWTIPGGGVSRNESYFDAAVREIKEETGLDAKELVLIGKYNHVIEYKKDRVEVYFAEVLNDKLKIDLVEIKEANWFARDTLPINRTLQTNAIFKLYDEYKSRGN